MKKFFKKLLLVVIVVILGLTGGFMLVKHEFIDIPDNISDYTSYFLEDVHMEEAEYEEVFKDNSKVIVTSRPRVYSPKASLDDLIVLAREDRRIKEETECITEHEKMFGIGKVTKGKFNVTVFGGSKDFVVRDRETGSISGEILRNLDPREESYMAWPMPDVTELNPKSPYTFPSVEEYFGKGLRTLGQKIEKANKTLDKDFIVQITSIDKDGNKKTAFVKPIDRGPAISTRIDLSYKACEELGIAHHLKGSPNNPNNMVELEIRLVRINPESEESTEPSDSKIQLPSWTMN